MPTYIGDARLFYIYQAALDSEKIKGIIEEKNYELIDHDNTQSSTFKKLTPAPVPKGEKRIFKNHKIKSKDEKTLERQRNGIKDKHDQKIKAELHGIFKKGERSEMYEFVDSMTAKNLATLCEKGPILYQEHLQKEQLTCDLDSPEISSDPITRDFANNSKSMGLKDYLTPNDDFE